MEHVEKVYLKRNRNCRSSVFTPIGSCVEENLKLNLKSKIQNLLKINGLDIRWIIVTLLLNVALIG